MTTFFRPNLFGLRIFITSFLGAQLLLFGCQPRERQPITYLRVGTMQTGNEKLGEPFGVAVKGDSVLVSDGVNGTVVEITADGSSKVIASGLHTPSAIAFLPNGDLVVADTGSHTIRQVDANGAINILAGVENVSGIGDGNANGATFNAPVGLAVAEDGSIFVSDTYNDRIRLIRDGVVSTIAGGTRGFADGIGTAARFDTPLGIAVLGKSILVADSRNARLRVVEPDGTVWTLSGGDEDDLIDGSLATARFVNPTAVAVDRDGSIFVADGDAVRVIGARALPFVETLAGDRRGFADGAATNSRFNRPSGLTVGLNRELYVADSDNRAIRVVGESEIQSGTNARPGADEVSFPLATRWPFDPPANPREIAGTLGEIRGAIGPKNKPVWFHNGLDIAGAYGEVTKFIRDETVLNPQSSENFGTSRELLRLPLIGYIHLRLGRDKSDTPFGDPRFQFDRDAAGKLIDVRVRRGTRFAAGDALGTLNSMNHVHLIAGRSGDERNAIAALELPGVGDSIVPVIEKVSLFSIDWRELEPEPKSSQISLPEKTRVVVRAYDRMDGNSERRRLGVYRVGYQLLSNGTPVAEPVWSVSFDRMPSNDAVRFAYAEGSQSGYSPTTIFDYIATNRVDGDSFGEGFLDSTTLASGTYTLRVLVADYFGNVGTKDVPVVK